MPYLYILIHLFAINNNLLAYLYSFSAAKFDNGMPNRQSIFLIYYLAPGGGCEVLFSPGLSVCVSVCPTNILVFYLSAVRRDIDLKFIHDTYRVVLNSQGRYIAFWRYSTSLITTNWAIDKLQFFFIDTSQDTLFVETIKTRANREMTSKQIR